MKKYLEQQLRTENKDYSGIQGRMSEVSNTRLMHAAFGLTTESGEFADSVKRTVFYGTELNRVNLIEEMGDIMYYLAMACNTLDVSLEDIMNKNIAKLEARYKKEFTLNEAVDRNLTEEISRIK